MMYKCGKEITPHVPAITQLCLDYICYDPNYNYNLGMQKSDVIAMVIGATLVGTLLGVVLVALWGGLSLL